MLLNFKNEHIFFAVEAVWYDPEFDYKLQTQLNQLASANSEEDFVQQIEISKESLLQVFKALGNQPESIVAVKNQEMLEVLIPQLESLSNKDIDNPNEAFSTLLEIQEISKANVEKTAAFISRGKSKILA